MQKHRLFNFFMIFLLCLGSIGGLTNSSAAAASPAEESANSYMVARVYFDDRAELDLLASELDVWEVNHSEGYLIALLSNERYEQLSQAGYLVVIDQAKTEQVNQPLVALPEQGSDSIPGYPCYRTVEENYQDMEDMETGYPDLVEVTDIGNSWEKMMYGGDSGYDMLMLRLTNENLPEKYGTFFLMAATHARELVTTETAMRMAEYILSQYGSDPDITWLLDYYELYLVPVANPDGRKEAETGQSWRKNVDNNDGCSSYPYYGTDLNRNNGFHWGGASSYACDETYQGPSANSEPENWAIQAQVQAHFPDQRGSSDTDPAPLTATGLFITLHSYSELVLWPWGWTGTDAPNHTQLQTLGRRMAYFNDYEPQQANDLYGTTGTHDDWTYGTRGIASYTFEMGTTFFQDCTTFENTIYPDNLDALLNGIKASRRPYMTPAGPESLNVAVSSAIVLPGEQIQLTASANDTRYSSNNGTEPTQDIAEAHYSIDAPAFVTDTVTYPMDPKDGTFDDTVEDIEVTINTTGWTAGRHTIFVESRDTAGNWGYVSAVFLDIAEAPSAEFSSNSPVAAGRPMAFTNESSGWPTPGYLWDFGDGIGTSTEENPSYLYTGSGTYTVVLTATNDYGMDVVTHTVEVIPCVDITGLEVSLETLAPIYPGDIVDFSVDLTPDDATMPYTYTIDYDDGNTFEGSSSDDPQTFSHTFDTAGDFSVMVGALTCNMTEPVTNSVDVTVSEPAIPLISVDLSLETPGTIYIGSPVDFSADLLPDEADKPFTYTVDFGDGSTALTGQSDLDPLPITHTFATTGSFTVMIEAWNSSTSEPVTDSLDLIVYDLDVCVPLTGITIEGASEGEPGIYTFTTSYAPADASLPLTYLWDNGDVTADSVRTLAAGIHTLTVSTGNCETSEVTATHTITISPISAEFSTFLPLVSKAESPQGMTNQVQKGSAGYVTAMSWLALPALVSGVFSLPVIKKLR